MSKGQPLISDIERMWRELEVIPVPSAPAAQRLTERLRSGRTNGGAHYAVFHVVPHPILNWFIQTSRLSPPSLDFASRMVTQEVVRQSLPELEIPPVLPEPLVTEALDSFELEASLSRALVYGGAYSSSTVTRQEARRLSGEFVDTVHGHRDALFTTTAPWTPWFWDIAWDSTWLGLIPNADNAPHLFWLLCVTDTD